MPKKDTSCQSLAEYIQQIQIVVDDWTPRDAGWYLQPWFRGHADADWPLRPSIFRLKETEGIGAEYYNEKRLLESFKLRAPLYLDRMPETDWQWLFVMQHYGLPTRLLDWTESALIALFFALRDNHGNCDASVWVTNPWWINKQVFEEHTLFAASSTSADPWRVGAPAGDTPRAPIAIRPVQQSARIQAQRGVFTIHGTDPAGLDKIGKDDTEEHCLRKLTIPANKLIAIRQELAVAGITESVVFPELPGLCREMKRAFFGI